MLTSVQPTAGKYIIDKWFQAGIKLTHIKKNFNDCH